MKKYLAGLLTILLVVLGSTLFVQAASTDDEISFEKDSQGNYSIKDEYTLDDYKPYVFTPVEGYTDYTLLISDPGAGRSFDIYMGAIDGDTVIEEAFEGGHGDYSKQLSLKNEVSYYMCVEHASEPGIKYTLIISTGEIKDTEAEKSPAIKLSKTAVSLKKGKSVKLSATVTNSKTQKVVWSTSNKKVATVKNGKVTAKGYGTAVITCKIKDTNISSTCTITVKKKKATVAADYSSITLGEKNNRIDFTYAGGSLCGAIKVYTLSTGNFSGELPITFSVGGQSDTQTITVEKNSNYELSYQYIISGGKDTVHKSPDQKIPNGMGGYIIIPGQTITTPAPVNNYNLKVQVGDKTFTSSMSTKGDVKPGVLNYEKVK